MGRFRQAIIISFLSITIAEFSTGSTPLTNIILNPASFFLFSLPALLGLYGCGVILIREATIIWKKGWPTTLALGLAYGIMEEGISVHTFFAPVNATVGVFGQYGRVLGMDVTWAIIISLFHSLYSISLPIMIYGLLRPETKEKRLLTKRSLMAVFAAYILTVAILDIVAPYRPAAIFEIILLAIAASLVYIGSRMPMKVFREKHEKKSRGIMLYLILGIFFFPFIIFGTRLQTIFPSGMLDAEIIIVSILIYRVLEINAAKNSAKKLSALAIGLIVPLLFFGTVISLRSNPLGIIAIAALLYIVYKISKVREITSRPAIESADH